MLIECLIRRVGPTPFFVPPGVEYKFLPIPGSKKGEESTSVCEVSNDEHVKYFLRLGHCREYDPETALADMRAGIKSNPLAGFSVQKYQENGYIAADYRDKNHPKYAGVDGKWTENRVNMVAFPNEVAVLDFLRSEVIDTAIMVDEKPSEEAKPTEKMSRKGQEALRKTVEG